MFSFSFLICMPVQMLHLFLRMPAYSYFNSLSKFSFFVDCNDFMLTFHYNLFPLIILHSFKNLMNILSIETLNFIEICQCLHILKKRKGEKL